MKNLLTYKNNWYSDEYYVNNKRISSLKEITIEGMLYKVHNRVVSVSYNDMGHTYDGTSNHYFINVPIGSIEVEVDLNKIVPKQEVIAIKYK